MGRQEHRIAFRTTASLRVDSGQQAIADRGLVHDQLGPGRLHLQLLTERANGDAQILRLLLLRRSPCRSKQMLVRQHPARMLRELSENGIFFRREVHVPPIARDDPLKQIDRHTARRNRLVLLVRADLDEIGNIAFELRRFALDRR